jgi:cell division protein FtsL
MNQNRKLKPKLLTPRVVLMGLMFLLLFVGEFFFKTWCGVQCIRTGYEISDALNKQDRLANIQKNLKIELVHLKSPQVLMKIAKEKLDLTIPNPEQVIVIP